MPVLPPVSSSSVPSLTIQSVIDFARTYPDVVPILGASGYSQQPALTIANDVLMKILAQGMDWKWNRAQIPMFLSVSLQQDYVTQVTDLGWLERGIRIDINNTANYNNGGIKPFWNLETVRELTQSSCPGYPFNASYIPNTLAQMGLWQPNFAYGCSYGQAMVPLTPLMQFVDANGNILFIDSTVLQLNPSSPGYWNDTPIVLPANAPYGTSGSTQPLLAPDTEPGTTVLDGTVTWTVANPDAYAIRFNPVPAQTSWLFSLIYQKKAPVFTDIKQSVTPIPNEYMYLFREGFVAACFEHAGSKMAGEKYAKWEEALMTALRAADRETEDFSFYPTSSIMGSGFNAAVGGIGIGPAWPYGGL